MGIEIEIEEETLKTLDKYANPRIRSANIGAMMGRVVEGWYTRMAVMWAKQPEMIPKFRKIPENRRMKTMIPTCDGRIFKTTIDKLNKKLGIQIDPCELATWLTEIFVKVYSLERKSENYKIKFGKIHRV